MQKLFQHARTFTLLVSALFAGLGSFTVLAQDQTGETSSSELVLEEVMVTAQKREERLQDVPAAISAVLGDDLKRNQINDVWALAATVPSFNMTQDSAVSQQLNIRGVVSVKLNDASAEPSVGMFVDEVYVPRMGSAFTDFYDLERIEVIRGPQGVLLGKNVVGGALSVITAKPSFERGAQATLSIGNYDSYMANGFLTGPLSEQWAGRFSFQVRERSGYNHNILLDRELDDLSSYQARGQLAYEGADGTLRALLSFDVGHDESNGTIRAAIDDFAIPGIGTVQQYRTANGIGPRQDFSTQPEYVERDTFGAMLRIDWQAFANAELTSITSFRDSEASWGYNQIGTGSPPAIVDTFVFQTETPRTFSQEVRLASTYDDSPWEWLVGAYYQHDDIDRPYQHIASTNANLAVFSGHSFYDASASISTAAIFGQASYEFDNGLRFVGGLRYLRDDKSGKKIATCIDDAGDGSCVTPLRLSTGQTWTTTYSETWDAWTPQGTVEYRINDAALVYGTIAKGFKGGGWDFIPPTPVAATISFDPEEVVNYELGIKSDLFSRRLRLNAAVFRMDYTDLQAQRTDLTCLCLITSNAGSARIDGVEVELTALVTEGLTLRGSASALDPKYIDYDDLSGNVYDGNTMQRTPEFKYNVGFDYMFGAGSWDDAFTLRTNYTHQSKIYWEPRNVSYEPGYGLLDASLYVQPPNASWSLNFWGKNLTDELYSQLGLPFLGDLVEVWGAPRTYGVDFTWTF